MSMTPRRRIIRPSQASPSQVPSSRQIQKVRSQLDKERQTLARWMRRLKRALHSFEKCQATVARLQKRLNQLEQ